MIQVSRRRCCHGNASAKISEQHWPRDSGFGNRPSQGKAYPSYPAAPVVPSLFGSLLCLPCPAQ